MGPFTIEELTTPVPTIAVCYTTPLLRKDILVLGSPSDRRQSSKMSPNPGEQQHVEAAQALTPCGPLQASLHKGCSIAGTP